jgi:RNA polymerase sigma-70 factor (ECF subfamily)
VLDALRRRTTLRRALPALAGSAALDAVDDGEESDVTVLDDRLRLVLTCCHPALSMEARVALTLRMVGGLTTDEIAHAFLVSEPTMAARITRAKRKITAAQIPYRLPPDAELPDRLDGVLAVLHLIFTTGHTAPSGAALQRRDLAEDALDLTRVLAVLMPDEPEVLGLLALLELTHARRPAREIDGRLVLLADQDRSRWDADLVARGLHSLTLAGTRLGPTRRPGRYLLQAGIAAVHAEASTFEQTDWDGAVRLYDRLLEVWPSPIVRLNRAVATGFRDGPAAGLAQLDALGAEPALSSYHYLPAARAELLLRLGRRDDAARAYAQALSLVGNEAERAFLSERVARLSE